MAGESVYYGGSSGDGAFPTFPKWSPPKPDEGRIAALSQASAAPYVGQLRRGLQRSMAMYAGSPNAQEDAYRSALEGYGAGLSNIMSQAGRSGLQRYQSLEFDPAMEASKQNWQLKQQKMLEDYYNRQQPIQQPIQQQQFQYSSGGIQPQPFYAGQGLPSLDRIYNQPATWERSYGPGEIIGARVSSGTPIRLEGMTPKETSPANQPNANIMAY